MYSLLFIISPKLPICYCSSYNPIQINLIKNWERWSFKACVRLVVSGNMFNIDRWFHFDGYLKNQCCEFDLCWIGSIVYESKAKVKCAFKSKVKCLRLKSNQANDSSLYLESNCKQFEVKNQGWFWFVWYMCLFKDYGKGRKTSWDRMVWNLSRNWMIAWVRVERIFDESKSKIHRVGVSIFG